MSVLRRPPSSHVDDSWPRKISIIGAAGLVGSTVAAQLVLTGVGSDIYLQDRKTNILQAHFTDLNDARAIRNIETPRLHLREPPAGEADIVIVAASIAETPDGDRRAFLEGNADILNSLSSQLKREVGNDGIVLLLSNPVDVLADWLCSATGFDPSRVLGYALNDSARFRLAIARELGVPVSSVEGVVYGEHGRGQVPIMSNVRVAGKPVTLTSTAKQRVAAEIHGWFERWSQLRSGRSSGWATGVGTAFLIQQLAAGQPTVATASTYTLTGLGDTFMALPVKREGAVVRVEDLTLPDSEFTHLQVAAESIREAAKTIRVGR